MSKFKVGDRVRLKVDRFDIADLRAGDVGTLRENDDGAPFVDWERIGDYWAIESTQLELVPVAEATGTAAQADKPKFKVGDRVRYGDLVCAGTGVVARVFDDDSCLIKVEDQHRKHCPFGGGTTRHFWADYLEPVAVAQQPQPSTLTIQPGRHYITRDGRKVGPARQNWGDSDYPWWVGESTYTDSGAWVDCLEHDNDLVAEADEPPAEQQSTKEILDELEAWIAEQDAIKTAGKSSTAGFTVPLCAYDDEPGWYAAELGRAYADGYAAGLRAAA